MSDYAELRAALSDGSFDFDQRAYMNDVRALLAERDALRRQLEWTAQYANESVMAGSRDLDDWIGDMQHIEISARTALAQGQGGSDADRHTD